MSDMPFQARQLTRAWPHTETAHGGAPWWCGKVPSRRVGVRFPSSFNGFRPRGCERGSKGFLNGAPGDLSVHPFCEGVGKRFPLAHTLEGKRVNQKFTSHPTLSFQCPAKGSPVSAQGEQLGVALGWTGLGVWVANFLGNVLKGVGPLLGIDSSN
jgi:hypothetical protein